MNPLPILVSLPLMIMSMLIYPTPALAPASSPPFNDKIITPPVPPPKPAKRLENRQSKTVTRLAKKWSKVFHVPKSWIRSQAWVETQDRPDAVNPVTGAMGVMQIMPRTYEWLLPSLKRTKFAKNYNVKKTLHASATGSTSDLRDVDLNIMMATYLMVVLKKKFGNDHKLVAAAYDAGHVLIAKCLDKKTAFPAQVQEYVARVEAAKQNGFM